MPCPDAEPVLTGTQLLPSKRSAKRCATPLDRSRKNTTGPEFVATTFALSTTPTPLMPPAESELPKETQPPWPPLAVASYVATSIDDPVGPTDVQATTGLPPTMAIDGLAADPVAPWIPVPVVLPPSAVQEPPT